MEGINLNSVTHMKLLVEPKYGAHLSEKEGEVVPESER